MSVWWEGRKVKVPLQQTRKNMSLSARHWNGLVGFHPRQMLCKEVQHVKHTGIIAVSPCSHNSHAGVTPYRQFNWRKGCFRLNWSCSLILDSLKWWLWRPRPGSSDLEWSASILSDCTDPIVWGKLMESSLSMGFPLQRDSFLMIPSNNFNRTITLWWTESFIQNIYF